MDYFVPVSHELKNSMLIPGTKQNGVTEYYGIILTNRKGQSLGNLDFRHMLPCVDNKFLTPINPYENLGQFGIQQFECCNDNQNYIQQLARSAFDNIQSQDYTFLNETSVNTENILIAAWDYLDMTEERDAIDAKMTARINTLNELASNISTPTNTEQLSLL